MKPFKNNIFKIIFILLALLILLLIFYWGFGKSVEKTMRKIISSLPFISKTNSYINHTIPKGYYLFVNYEDLGGLRNGDIVRCNGERVGKVEIYGINTEELEKRYIVLLKFNKRNFKVKENSKFYISTLGLGNVKYIEISAPPDKTQYLEKGSHVQGIKPSTVHIMPLSNLND
jgi:hypothetical protein